MHSGNWQSFSAQLFPVEFPLGRAAGSCAAPGKTFVKPGGWALALCVPWHPEGWSFRLENNPGVLGSCSGRLQGTIVRWLSWHTPSGTRSRGVREGES